MQKRGFQDLIPEGKLIPYRASEELPPGPWLILSPHPDDETIGMGGTIAKASSRGIEVYVVELTLGERGGDPEVRKSEAFKALSILGVSSDKILFAGFPEGSFLEREDEYKRLLTKLFSEIRPITLFVPSPFEYHPDHRLVSLLTIEWIKENLDSFKFHHLMAFYEITRASEANFLVCIDDHVKIKTKALKAFSSQADLNKYLKVSLGINKMRTYSIDNCSFAEAFFLNPIREFDKLFLKFIEYLEAYVEGEFLNLLGKLKEKEEYIELMKSEIWNLKQEYKKEIMERDNLIHTLEKEIDFLKNLNFGLQKNSEKLQNEIEHLQKELLDIQNTLWWKTVQAFYRFRDKLLPEGTFRRRCYNVFKKLLYMIINREFKQLFLYTKDKLAFNIRDEFSKGFCTEIGSESDIITLKKLEKVTLNSSYDVSVVSVIYNNDEGELKRFLNSIESSSIRIKELIIVDNSDKKNLKDFFDKNFSIKIKYIKTDNNIGFGRGVNLGVKYAEAEFVLIINPDTEIKENAVELLLKMLTFKEDVAVAEALQFPYEHPKYYNPITLEPVWFSGCCFMIKKEIFEKIGGFDENIFLYAEDVDLSWRLKLSGYKIKYVPSAQVWHDFTSERSSLHKYNPLSNLYLRLKYGYSLKEWFLLYLGKGVFSRDVIKYFKAGIKIRKDFKNKFDFSDISKYVFFDSVSLGYEPFRRRGFDVPFLELRTFPKVSVIIRTHNRKKLLRRALTSLANQTYENFEVLVVEDKTHVAPEVIKDFNELDIKYFSVSEGRTRALNKGMEEATGKYIMFLDDDDLVFSDALQLLVSYAEAEGFSFVYGGSVKFETDDKFRGVLKHSYFEPFDREKMMRENYIPMGSFIISKELAQKVGYFDESLEYLEDWDFIRRAAKIVDFLFVPKDILIYCVPQSKSLFWKRQEKLDEAYGKVIAKDKLSGLQG